MLDALGVKVTEVHCCSVDCRLTNLSTLEKLSSVEYRMSLLLQHIESIPEESLEILRQLKDSERRSRFVSLTVIQPTAPQPWNKEAYFSMLDRYGPIENLAY